MSGIKPNDDDEYRKRVEDALHLSSHERETRAGIVIGTNVEKKGQGLSWPYILLIVSILIFALFWEFGLLLSFLGRFH